ncbi:MAG: bifunctional phosphopantothenoylcysteine decarboxylase/phosphopantothenate--cysteine ligase CoaBC [Candidatus Hadarchaeia archaeon]
MEHPSKDIIGTEGEALNGANIALCVTGSVASIRAPDLCRKLMRQGAEVRVVMSEKATDLVTPELLHWASGNPVVSRLTGEIEHVEIAQWADEILVAPATGNTIGKIASSIDDTPPTSLVSVAQGLDKPIGIVPAMHQSMYTHGIIKENIDKLRDVGIRVLSPLVSEGKAKIPPVDDIVSFAVSLFHNSLDGVRVLVTAGPTREKLDPIRFISNSSSGLMGVSLARAANSREAEVDLVYGPGTHSEPVGVRTERVETTEEMLSVSSELVESNEYDLAVFAAAPEDLRPKKSFLEKIRHEKDLTVDLEPTPRILENVSEMIPEAFLVGFKAEFGVTDDELEKKSRNKLRESDVDLVAANDLSRSGSGFESPSNEVLFVSDGYRSKMKSSKIEIANKILDIFLKNSR